MHLLSFGILFATFIGPASTAHAGIFGDDDRTFVTATSAPGLRELARSIAVHIPRSRIENFDDREATSYRGVSPTYRAEYNLCGGIRFDEEASLPTCTAFLVGPRTLLTAGHCGLVNAAGCAGAAWAFDYFRDSTAYVKSADALQPDTLDVALPASLLYRCSRILASKYDPEGSRVDFALVELDRVVEGRTPLKLKSDGTFTGRENLFTIGALGGTALVAIPASPISSVTEFSLHGTWDFIDKGSGSPFFDAATGEVVGIGEISSKDFYYHDQLYPPAGGKPREACQREFVLEPPFGETVTTPTGIVKAFPYTEAVRIDYLEKRVPFLSLIR